MVQEWLSYLLRWVHLIAGISWIGSSFYFMWLDSHLRAPEKPSEGVEGELWMVHSGGFYQVEKRKIRPGEVPPELHWFKWEATLTWVSGIALLAVVYYLSGASYLIDPSKADLTPLTAILISLGFIAVSWVIYDLLWCSRLSENTLLANLISIGLFCVVTYALCQLFSGRAAYIHVGAIIGTIMVANVWQRILPAQQKMIDATQEGKTPDYTLGIKAKKRSVHNSYVTLPVLFIMLSNHYPMTYGHELNWVILLLLFFFGAGIRHAMIAKDASKKWIIGPVIASAVALFIMTAPVSSSTSTQLDVGPVDFQTAKRIILTRCISCHSENPTDDVFKVAPAGALFDSDQEIQKLAEKIKAFAVTSKAMPLANKTGMTDDERALLGAWIDQGAKID